MSEFCPEVWPEDPTPKSKLNCKECGLYHHGTSMIWGEGNANAPITIILDNPGAREDSAGNLLYAELDKHYNTLFIRLDWINRYFMLHIF